MNGEACDRLPALFTCADLRACCGDLDGCEALAKTHFLGNAGADSSPTGARRADYEMAVDTAAQCFDTAGGPPTGTETVTSRRRRLTEVQILANMRLRRDLDCAFSSELDVG